MNAANYSRKDRNGYTSTREPLRFTARKPQVASVGEITEFGICGLQIEVASEVQAERLAKACEDRRWAVYAADRRGRFYTVIELADEADAPAARAALSRTVAR